jgi:ubiquinone/menaquinone biosynthesis C-methylase UbiE
MSLSNEISEHYTHGQLTAAIERGVVALGKTIESIEVNDLAAVDEFHVGGRQASIEFLEQLSFTPEQHVLDVGCGLGGASRFVASHYGPRVSGIDLTAEYVDTGRHLCAWVGLDGRVSLHHGSALEMPFADASFDQAYMMHVGMNIQDKTGLFSEVRRVLRPGACFGVYDIMRVGSGNLSFPVPWAAVPDTSAVATPEAYKKALAAAGFVLEAERNRRTFALEFFAQLSAGSVATGGPPPLGIHLLMGGSGPTKRRNMVENITKNRIAPVEMIARVK